jgi:hypothetical protein
MRVPGKSGFVCEAVHRNAITKNGATIDEHVFVTVR